MDANPASSAPAPADPPGEPAASAEQPPPAAQTEPERYGPLDLDRGGKADGRALLLFTRRRAEQD